MTERLDVKVQMLFMVPIWCDVCKYDCYVGATRGCLYTRVQNHLSSIIARSPAVVLPVRSHFWSPDHGVGNARVVGLERFGCKMLTIRRRMREKRWMSLLGTQGAVGSSNIRYG